MITRFAPSPTGLLHVGHAMAAAQAFNYAAAEKGTCLLRVEDIDHTRCKPEYIDSLYEDLTWLGCKWPEPVRIQSEHMDDYVGVIEQLRARGLLYPCFKSRREIGAALEQSGEDVYRGPTGIVSEDEVKTRTEGGDAPAWRISMERAKEELGAKFDQLFYMEMGNNSIAPASPWQYGDEIIARRDIGVSYHIACVHDDALQNITHVIRGADFSDVTGFQVLLQSLLGYKTPLYFHHDLIADEEGVKLSKSRGDITIASQRGLGKNPQEVLDMAFVALER